MTTRGLSANRGLSPGGGSALHIVITGEVGVGKTTVCRRVVARLNRQGYTCGGILTPKADDGGIIVIDLQTGQEARLASLHFPYPGPRMGKYFFNPDGITFGQEAIRRGTSSDVLLVDEIGPLELSGKGFSQTLEPVRAGRLENCILVVRKGLLGEFLTYWGGDVALFETTTGNRDELPQQVVSAL